MARKKTEADVEAAPELEWSAQTPCPECGGRPGYNPATGVENRQGHRLGCSHWRQE